MLRRTAFAGITGLCLLAACGDDDGGGLDEVGGGAGVGGARAGAPSGGRAGAPRGGSGGGEADAGDPGRGGSSPAEAGAINEPGEGGTPSTGTGGSGEAGGPTNTAGSGGTAGTAGTGPTTGGTVEPGTVGGAGGAGGSDDGTDVIGGAGGDTSNPDPEPVGLVAHFTFNEKAGMTAADATGHFGPATLKSGATWTTGRAATGGVELAADGAHVQLPNGLFAGAEKATVAAWVNLTSYEPWSRIFDINGGGKGFVYLASDRGTGANEGMRFSIYTGDPATESTLVANPDLPLAAWKHVAVTVDGDTHSIFVDGILVARGPSKGRFPAEIEPTMNGWLGKSTITTDRYLKARLDEFRVYDVVLTNDDIQDLAWPDRDYSHYRFEETTENEVVDYSDRALHGTIRNGAGFTEGRRGDAILLEGGPAAGAHHHVALPPTLLEDCDDLTIALWAKIDTATNYSRFLEIDGKVNGFLYFSPTIPVGTAGTPELRFNIIRPGVAPQDDEFVSAPYPAGTVLTGTWHHFAVTLAGNTARLFFNGNQIAVKTDMTRNPSDIEIGTGAHAWIGKTMFPDPHLDAAIDDYRVSCRAYTADEIKMLAR